MEEYNFKVVESPSGMKTVTLLRSEKENIGLRARNMTIEDMKKEVINNHLENIANAKVSDEWEANFEGLTAPELLKHKLYSHSRRRDYGITFYAHASHSPTGVLSIGGMSYDEEKEFVAQGLI